MGKSKNRKTVKTANTFIKCADLRCTDSFQDLNAVERKLCNQCMRYFHIKCFGINKDPDLYEGLKAEEKDKVSCSSCRAQEIKINCGKCQRKIDLDGYVFCYSCLEKFHFTCCNVQQSTQKGRPKKEREKWRCLACREFSKQSGLSQIEPLQNLTMDPLLSGVIDNEDVTSKEDSIDYSSSEEDLMEQNASQSADKAITENEKKRKRLDTSGNVILDSDDNDQVPNIDPKNNEEEPTSKDLLNAINKVGQDLRGEIQKIRDDYAKQRKEVKSLQEDMKKTKQGLTNLESNFKNFKTTAGDMLQKHVSELGSVKDSLIEEIKKEALNKLKQDYIKELNEVNYEIKNLKTVLKDKDDKIEWMNEEINKANQYGRRFHLEFQEIPKEDDENLKDMVKKLAGLLGVTMTEKDIQAVHRIPTRNEKRIPPIIIEFTHREIRDNFLKNRKKIVTQDDLLLNGNGEKIYIKESLSKFFRDLEFAARFEFKYKKNFKFVWYNKNQILIRKNETSKLYKISNFEQLNELLLKTRDPPRNDGGSQEIQE